MGGDEVTKGLKCMGDGYLSEDAIRVTAGSAEKKGNVVKECCRKG